MKKTIKLCLSSGITAYAIKFFVDLIMYIFMKNDQNDLYYDFWYLYIPQIVSTVFIIGFYILFFSKRFYGIFTLVSTIVVILTNIVFAVLLHFDSIIGYTYYFALVAGINFLNSFYLKCNIIPERKPGNIEYIPLFFELIPFVSMIISLCSLFCAFPTLQVTSTSRTWDYYNVVRAMKFNMIAEAVIIFSYILCMLNKAEIINDCMVKTPEEILAELDEEYTDNP